MFPSLNDDTDLEGCRQGTARMARDILDAFVTHTENDPLLSQNRKAAQKAQFAALVLVFASMSDLADADPFEVFSDFMDAYASGEFALGDDFGPDLEAAFSATLGRVSISH